MNRIGVDFAVDLGTSPHGLSADLPENEGEYSERPGCAPPASQQTPQGCAEGLEVLASACSRICKQGGQP